MELAKTMTVTIPACENHAGFHAMRVEISTKCPICGGPRGEPYAGLSYDGSMRLQVSQWNNPCGHIDKYSSVREEVKAKQVAQN